MDLGRERRSAVTGKVSPCSTPQRSDKEAADYLADSMRTARANMSS